jgi:hypothetical protein
MQFDITGFLIFLGFVLPGFVAQKSRDSIVPRSLKPFSTLAEVGEFVLAALWVHLILILAFRVFFLFAAKQYFGGFVNTFHYGSLQNFCWSFRALLFSYLVLSLVLGYFFGFLQGWLVLRQPVRNWVLERRALASLLAKIGIPGFLKEQPVWYFALKLDSPSTTVFVEVEMKNSAGFYTGVLLSYGILDDCVKSKDFFLVEVQFKQSRNDSYVPLQCNGVLLNFEDAVSVQVIKSEPNAALHVNKGGELSEWLSNFTATEE